jgi:tight adherence protein B
MSWLEPASFGVLVAASLVLVAVGLAVRRREMVLETLGWSDGRSPSGLPAPMSAKLRQGWMTPGVVTAAGALAGWTLLGPGGAVAGAVGAIFAVRTLVRRAELRGDEALEEQFRDAVVAMAAAVQAGLSVRRALAEVARGSDRPLRLILETAVRRLDVGEPLDAVLASLSEDLRTPDAPLLVALLEIHRRAGGDLPSMLDELGSLIGQRREVRRELRALTAQGRASGAVLAVLPIAFVTLLSWTGGDGLGDFYRTTTGSAFLLAGLGLEGLGFLWIRRLLAPRGAA